MKQDIIYAGDPLVIEELTIFDRLPDGAQGGAVDLTGREIIALLGVPGSQGILGTVTAVDFAAGKVRVEFPGGSVAPPVVQAQVRVDGQVAYAELFAVHRAVIAP